MIQIPLTRGLNALIDDRDADLVLSYPSWAAGRSPTNPIFYAKYNPGPPWNGGTRRPTILMHRLILGAPKGVRVDHINGNGLDNRRANLRFATAHQNSCNKKMRRNNTSGFIGVHWHQGAQKWRATITTTGQLKSLGLFTDREDAARARDRAAIELHGQFARLNFTDPVTAVV